MLKKTYSVAEMKASLSEHIRDVQRGEPVLITRHGKAVAALVNVEDLERLERLRAAGPDGGLASLAGGWEGSDDLVRMLDDSSRIGQRDAGDLDRSDH